jgi:xanthine dehydrogenase YagR molybdenum-binding subunit
MMPNFMRGVAQSSGLFGLESAVDELAFELGLDPIEIRCVTTPTLTRAQALHGQASRSRSATRAAPR